MPQFYTGDELGAIKSIKYARDVETKQWKADVQTVFGEASAGKAKAVQKLALHRDQEENTLVSPEGMLNVERPLRDLQVKLAAFRADGSTSVLKLDSENPSFSESSQWKESRLKDGQRFVGGGFTKTYVKHQCVYYSR